MAGRKDIGNINLMELLGFDVQEVSGLPSYERIYEYYCVTNRECGIGVVEDGSVCFIRDHIIKWNKEDDTNNIPINQRKPIII